MIEKNPIREARLEFSRKTSALYPEYSSLFPDQELERIFFNRCRRNGKDAGMIVSGSPNHGDQWWSYDGKSQLFTISSSFESSGIQEEGNMAIESLFNLLKMQAIALFNPFDVRNANSIAALPKTFRNNLAMLDDLVTKGARNGIILVKP